MTPAQLAALRDSLPPFASVGLVPAQLQDYCRFYGLDFEARLPRVHHRIGSVTAGPYTLAAQCWLQPGASANLLLVHGYFDHAGLYGKLIEFGLLNNCNVLIFDLPGHGLSSGEPAVIGDFGDYGLATGAVLEAARPSPELPLWVMAQSTGCAALVEHARDGRGPAFVEVVVTPLYNPDVPAHRDPVERLRRFLDHEGLWTPAFEEALEREILGQLDRAFAYARGAAPEEPR